MSLLAGNKKYHFLSETMPMNKDEARGILNSALKKYRERTYKSLLHLLDNVDAYQVETPCGVCYQLEVQARWDDKPHGDLRVMGSIGDGGFFSSLSPLTDSFILSPGGNFVDK